MNGRVGHGFDVHRFGEGDTIVIGGVEITFDRGLVAHSDGDVLLHALCDALLGAAALGDIGQHFSDQDEQFANISSRVLLRSVYKKIVDCGLIVGNVDCTIVAQRPKMAPHIMAMKTLIAEDLHLSPQQVNVKATTTENLGYVGREEGIAAHAVAMIYPKI